MHLVSPFKQEYGDAIHYCIQCNAAPARAFWDPQRPGVCGKDMEAQPGLSLLLPEACPWLSADSGNCEPHRLLRLLLRGAGSMSSLAIPQVTVDS